MKLLIRPYAPGDWDSIAAAHDAARKIELHLAGLDQAFLPLSIAAEREGLFDYDVAVAELDGQVVGFSACTEEELAWLYVNPGHHRQGIGSALIRHGLETHPAICALEVLEGNLPARACYEKHGFHLDHLGYGRMPGNEEFRVTVYCMSREPNL